MCKGRWMGNKGRNVACTFSLHVSFCSLSWVHRSETIPSERDTAARERNLTQNLLRPNFVAIPGEIDPTVQILVTKATHKQLEQDAGDENCR